MSRHNFVWEKAKSHAVLHEGNTDGDPELQFVFDQELQLLLHKTRLQRQKEFANLFAPATSLVCFHFLCGRPLSHGVLCLLETTFEALGPCGPVSILFNSSDSNHCGYFTVTVTLCMLFSLVMRNIVVGCA